MKFEKHQDRRRNFIFGFVFFAANIVFFICIAQYESVAIDKQLSDYLHEDYLQFSNIIDDYKRTFLLMSELLKCEINCHSNPDEIESFLKSRDRTLLSIEGSSYDGLYLFYKNRYLYSWNTPFEVYESSGYNAKERPWYQNAVSGDGNIILTPPYMSYANDYMLSTIAQLQDDKETVFAYDIRLEKIQNLLKSFDKYRKADILLYDKSGSIVGSSEDKYLGGNVFSSIAALQEKEDSLLKNCQQLSEWLKESLSLRDLNALRKQKQKYENAVAFRNFMQKFSAVLNEKGILSSANSEAAHLDMNQVYPIKKSSSEAELSEAKWFFKNAHLYTTKVLNAGQFSFLIIVPVGSMMIESPSVWLVPFLFMELLIVSIIYSMYSKLKNKDLKIAYRELGYAQKQLENAYSKVQKAATTDALTGLKNEVYFKKAVKARIANMASTDNAIFIMFDIDKFKSINDNYGHLAGDE